MNCRHENYEPVEVNVLEDPYVVGHICRDCLRPLPSWWGCEDCETYEIRKLSEAVPTIRLGTPCRRHQEDV